MIHEDITLGPVRLIRGDCTLIAPTLQGVDAVITDPPYGIGYDPSKSNQQGIQKFQMIHGDEDCFDPSSLMKYKDAIVWGCNNFCDRIPPRIGQWYFWDKVTQNSLNVRIAEGEFAWHMKGTKPRAFRHLWSGAYRDSESGERSEHPTQKPVALMSWCMDMAKVQPGHLVLDPYMGSGTTLIAAIRTGRRAIGIEIDERHFRTAVERVRRELDQFTLPFETPKQPKDQEIFQ